MKAANDNYQLDDPIRLAEAVRAGFPHGGMTLRGLRREASRGRLVIERIAGKDFTSLRAIGEMRQLCRVQQKGPISGKGKIATTGKAESSLLAVNGSSSIEANTSPRDALLAQVAARQSKH